MSKERKILHSPYGKRSLAYIDTVGMWFCRRLTLQEKRFLRSAFEGRIEFRSAWVFKRPVFRVNGRLIPHLAAIKVQQPTLGGLKLLQTLFRDESPPQINKVDIALDVPTARPSIARALQAEIVRVLHKKGHRHKHEVRYDRGTVYLGFRAKRYQIAFYSGRPSKLCESPSMHMEHRFQSVSAVREIGITSIDALLNFDTPKFFAKHLSFNELNVVKLGRVVGGRRVARDRNFCANRRVRFAKLVLRAIYDDLGNAAFAYPHVPVLTYTLGALRNLGVTGVRSALTPVHVSSLLPWPPPKLTWFGADQ